jgi:hypothetical protein
LVVGFTLPYFVGPQSYTDNVVSQLNGKASFSKQLTLNLGDGVRGSISPSSSDVDFSVLGPNNSVVLLLSDIKGTSSFNFTAILSGNYSLLLFNGNPSAVDYNLVFTVHPSGSWTYSWLTPVTIMAPALVFGGLFDGLQVRSSEKILTMRDKVSTTAQIFFVVFEAYSLLLTPQIINREAFEIVAWFLLALFVTAMSYFIGNPTSGRIFAIMASALWLFINTGILAEWGYLLGAGLVTFTLMFQYLMNTLFLVVSLVPLLLHRE